MVSSAVMKAIFFKFIWEKTYNYRSQRLVVH